RDGQGPSALQRAETLLSTRRHGTERLLHILLSGDRLAGLLIGQKVGIEEQLVQFGLAKACITHGLLGNVENELAQLPVVGWLHISSLSSHNIKYLFTIHA